MICEANHADPAATARELWRCFEVEGPIPHTAVGILASLTEVLRAGRIPVLALSTYDTDYLFVPDDRAKDAVLCLRRSGYTIDTRGESMEEEGTK